ncbi:receptor-like protein EIX1 [Morus notabilis]|uniref:receptor-like protein EIX1 n=1 Tax=Morus notabilis TaxID=981085 RepID=UPI000CED1C45|nr:receptor-like protein EIX1 [Morus notabilis]
MISSHGSNTSSSSSTGDGEPKIRCIEAERQALLKIKRDLQGVSNNIGDPLSSWGNEEEKRDCCKWLGIQCSSKSGNVISLDLSPSTFASIIAITSSYETLRGKISPSLFELRYLTYLDLGFIDFNESHIPSSISSLSRLRYLNLSNAFLSGEIPRQFSNLSSLEVLDLGSTGLVPTNILECASNLSSLRTLVLTDTNLGKASDWVQGVNQLSSLTNLQLSFSYLPNISNNPSSLSFVNSSTTLSFLDLRRNDLSNSIYPWLLNLNSLVYLDLSLNQLEGSIPEAFGKMAGLKNLDLSYNCLSGSIPEIFENKSGLEYLDLGFNMLQGQIPTPIWNQSKLRSLIMGSNNFSGHLPQTAFQQLKQLEILDISRNSMGGLHYIQLASCKLGHRFPRWLRTQKNYYFLDISSSEISDTIPDWVWYPSTREEESIYLNLWSNKIKGESEMYHQIFKQIFGDGALNFLDVSYNKLSGQLPDCWSHFKELQVLDLRDNNLSGKIPSSIGSLTAIDRLILANNSFIGEIPSTLKNCRELLIIDFGENKLSGPVPTWMGENMPSLVIFSLRSNYFDGSIPSYLCHLKHLQLLDLSLNDISGRMPACFHNFTAMKVNEINDLNMKNPILISGFKYVERLYRGEVQVAWKGDLKILQSTIFLVKSIDLSSNKLIGEIPREITQLSGLVSLNLSRNSLSGQIPSEIGQLTSLDALDLSWNHLVGQIPPSLTHIDRLNALDLSNNNLNGKIPTSTQLQSFPSAYTGNVGLCRDPLPKKCPDEEHESTFSRAFVEEVHDELLDGGFYISIALGFVVGFWGVCGALIFNKSFRYAYFELLNDVGDCICVKAVMHKAKLLRIIKS